jgi:hypothetical protein
VNRAALAIVLAALTLTSACGGSDGTDTPATQDTPTATESVTASATASATPTKATGPEYAALAKEDLEAALLTIQDMPVGYSQDPPSEPSTKTFCDYRVPFTEKVYVSRDFTKGGGMSTEFLSIGLRQFDSSDQARASFDALTKTLNTYHEETYDGTKLEYALMSAPKVGDDTVGIRITADGTTILQNFALVGPTLVNTGGGGIMQSNADEIAHLLEAQVEAYQTAAAK